MPRLRRAPWPLLALLALTRAAAAEVPVPVEGDVVLKGFAFQSGEQLPELRVHYRAVGTPRRDAGGVVQNAVLVLHGTTGSGAQFFRPEFAGELFGPGQPLDAARFYVILPDAIGHGRSSKPSDGLHARFPRYGYLDMIEAQRRLLAEGLGVAHLRLVMGTADDLINPPELGILEREVKRVPRGRALLLPRTELSRGHGSHTLAALWKEELVRLLAATGP